MLGPDTCLQTELEVGEDLRRGLDRREATGWPSWMRDEFGEGKNGPGLGP